MEHFFSELRNRPYRYRRNVALGVAVICTFTISVFWLISTKERFAARLEKKTATSTLVAELASPFETISQSVDEGLDTIQKQFEELSKVAK